MLSFKAYCLLLSSDILPFSLVSNSRKKSA